MLQHTGKAAIPVVNKDDTVKEGQLIGRADGFISANVHASVPGRVIDIGYHPTPFSENGLCVVIESEGNFSFENHETASDISAFSPDEIRRKISEAGIVGLGGAAFPTHVKLSPPAQKQVDTLIINGAECEPYLTADDMLMRTHADDIITGTRLLMKAILVTKAIIGIESNKKAAYKAMKLALKKLGKNSGIEIKKLPAKYPQGSEKQIIESCTGRQVPSGGLPMDARVVVQNTATAYAAVQAVCFGKPLTEKFITVTGTVIRKPGNYKVKIGTLISEIIEECGGFTQNPSKIILGGPMCGFPLPHANIPVVKGTNGILFLSRKETSVEKYFNCIRCGKCVSVCPAGLMPLDIANAAEKGKTEIFERTNPLDCMLCGSCTYVCPAKRPLTHFIKIAQQQIRSKR